jgi:flagellin-like protein
MGYILKGVSPVVASVLLIAFSIAIATLVGTWAMNYTQKELNTLDDKSHCQGVSLQQVDFKYEQSSRQGIIRVQNSGDSIKGYRVYAFNDNDQQLLQEISEEVKKGNIRTIPFETNISGVNEIMVEVSECPQVKLRFSI